MRPPFWLKVRKDYIFDNIDELIEYLSLWHYDISDKDSNKDFDSTLDCMVDLLDDIADAHYKAPVYQLLPDFLDSNTDDNYAIKYVRLAGAAILASLKSRRSCSRVMLNAVGLLQSMRNDHSSEILDHLWRIAIHSSRGDEPVSSGISWNDISSKSLSIPVFIHKLANATFKETETSDAKVFEGCGLALIDRDPMLKLAPMNLHDYTGTPADVQISITNRLQVIVARQELESLNSYQAIFKSTSEIIESQVRIKPSAKVTTLPYNIGDTLLVRITGNDSRTITAESLDSKHEYVSGRLVYHLDYTRRPNRESIIRCLTPGSTVEVEFTGDTRHPFELGNLVEHFYRESACDMANEVTTAVFLSETENYTCWISREGIRVRIHNNKLDELTDDENNRFEEAIGSGAPIVIRFYKEAQDLNKEKFIVYAQPEFSAYPTSLDKFTTDEANDFMINSYVSYCNDIHPMPQRINYENMDSRPLEVMAKMLFHSSINADLSSQDTLKYLSSIAMICRITNDEDSFRYIQFQRRYHGRLNDFAANRPLHPLSCDDKIASLPDVKDKMAIFKSLQDYANPDTPARPADRSNLLEQVSTLVKASNDIIGIVGKLELNNIKHAIAKALDVDDEFVSILDNRTFYGIESISLEFKKSIVFPPANRRRFASTLADPEIQKWAILKAIMGFLNSQHGGELLLGVNDSGYADGMQEDIRELYRMNLIAYPDADHYRTYVQNIVDMSFAVYGRDVNASDITRPNVTYDIETNNEQREILRINVRPYSNGIVRFSGCDRPAALDECYLRLSGRTVPVTHEMQLEMLKWENPINN